LATALDYDVDDGDNLDDHCDHDFYDLVVGGVRL
jgi:hypothetical protein